MRHFAHKCKILEGIFGHNCKKIFKKWIFLPPATWHDTSDMWQCHVDNQMPHHADYQRNLTKGANWLTFNNFGGWSFAKFKFFFNESYIFKRVIVYSLGYNFLRAMCIIEEDHGGCVFGFIKNLESFSTQWWILWVCSQQLI